ncbi:autotransporter outer membrane beta-barrel domain-containing protein [Pontiella sulfatireligans]|uniref:Uncharacterized protein n=1 Tax=Pontiella sulfatireligans TaxID=2750658 RepID=A0A6C2UMS5_9BACT|nr:hypothetical protein [Pontiella sulfatireligans]VGO20677.1 hypothetical protein SCARR_02743 [Pontiella sulfatireligans]
MKKHTMILSLAALMVASMNGHAVDKFFWDASGDHLWGTASNWADTTGTTLLPVPDATDVVKHVKTPDNPLLVNGAAVVKDLLIAHNNETSVSVISNGVLNVAQDLKFGTFGAAKGKFSVDGGEVRVARNIIVGATSTGVSTLEVNSGSLTVTNALWLGNNAASTVENLFSMTGGSYESLANTVIGRNSPGKLEMSGGTLIATNSAFQVGEAGGAGTVNLSGGTIKATVIDIDRGAGGGDVNLLGGTLEVLGGYASAVEMVNAAQMHFEGGALQWKGDRLDSITNFVDGGSITWTNGMTNMLTGAWEYSWTNGESILYADYNDAVPGFSTVWAYNTATIVPPPQLPPDLDGPTTNVFNNLSGDGLYTTSNNWDILTVPTSVDLAKHDSIGGVLTVPSQVQALDMEISHNSTATVSVVTGGSLTVSNTMVLGSAGTTGVGVLSVDGGSVNVVNDLYFGRFGTGRNGICELIDGDITVGNKTYIGGNNAGSTGTLSIVNGTYDNEHETFLVGLTGNGTLNMNGGTLTLDIANSIWNPLRVGTGSGNGTVNLNGGEIFTGGMIVGQAAPDAGVETINLFGGTLQVEGGFGSAVQLQDDAKIHIEGGTFRWKGDRIADVTGFVTNGLVIWSDGMTNMLTESWDTSWTNGTSILYADFGDALGGYTTVWAFDTTSLPAGYDSFALQYNLLEGAEGDDDDDGLSNLGEYAINGNPTNAADTGQTGLSNDGSTFSYVHAKLANDSSVLYQLIDTTDLVNGTPGTNGYVSQVNGPVIDDYLTVTNNYDMTGKNKQFIELEIERQ